MKSVSIKKSVCIILSTLITLAFLLSNAAGILPGHNIVRADGGHSHSGALDENKDDHNGWTAWDNASDLPTDDGSYYLTTDVTLEKPWEVPYAYISFTKTTNICLNGHSITANGDFDAIIIDGRGSILNLYDESGNSGMITHAENKDGRGVYLQEGTFNMYGGTISGNNSDFGAGIGGDSSNVAVARIYGGKITGNTAVHGGGIGLRGFTGIYTPTIEIYGGEISGNSATDGGGVCVYYGTVVLSGGTISGNEARFGGGVRILNDDETFTMSGGTISGNTAPTGGGVYLCGGTFNMSGGIITNNTASSWEQRDDNVNISWGEFNPSGTAVIDGGLDSSDYTTICYKANGGTGTMASQIIRKNVDSQLSENTFVFSNKNFAVWNTEPDGKGTFYNDKQLVNVIDTRGLTLYALWSPFTITFADEDGTELSSKEYAYGTAAADITKPTTNPTKAPTDQYSYTFDGWTPEITDVKCNATYTAKYNSTVNKYTITFVDEDGTELSSEKYDYGTAAADIVKPADPTKAPTAQNTYTFDGWTPDVADVTGDATYTATYSSSINEYTIKFVDDTGKELSSAKYDYGTKAADIVIPDTDKAATPQYTYEFKNWDKVITDVIADATYTAVYTTTVNKYTVKFVNEDGTVVSSKQYDYGTKAADITKPADPTKTGTTQYTYTFDGWTPEIKDVTGDATYTAKFSSTVNKYTVKFVNEDGTVLQSSEVAYGETPSYTGKTPVKADTEDYTYIFSGWSPEISKVTGDSTYKAVFTEKQKVGTYYLKNIEGDGKGGDIIATFGRTENDENAINYLDKVKADGKVLTRDKDYTAKKGSVIITIKKAYLDTLSEGTHTLEVCFTDGASVTLDFTVKHQAKYHVGTNTNANAATSTNTNTNTKAQASVPATGEKVAKTVFIGAGCVILACALAGGVFAMKIKRKEEA
ncbi:MAG: hypothetical protein IKG30_06200 [Clostridiales bacterium]|nr:hypothetical protein [Clostridiales bacterium]